MIFNLYSVNDTLARIYYMPFQTSTVEPAIRVFSDLVNAKGESVYNNPEDFNLMHLGTFDDATGLITPFEKPVFIVSAVKVHEGYKDEIGNGSSV